MLNCCGKFCRCCVIRNVFRKSRPKICSGMPMSIDTLAEFRLVDCELSRRPVTGSRLNVNAPGPGWSMCSTSWREYEKLGVQLTCGPSAMAVDVRLIVGRLSSTCLRPGYCVRVAPRLRDAGPNFV